MRVQRRNVSGEDNIKNTLANEQLTRLLVFNAIRYFVNEMKYFCVGVQVLIFYHSYILFYHFTLGNIPYDLY